MAELSSETKKAINERVHLSEMHPERAEIFKLEILLIEGGYPYWFNFWEDNKVLWGDQPEPETMIDWENYKFLLEAGRQAGTNLAQISVCFDKDNKGKLELLDMRGAQGIENPTAKDGDLFAMLTAEDCYERIKNLYENM